MTELGWWQAVEMTPRAWAIALLGLLWMANLVWRFIPEQPYTPEAGPVGNAFSGLSGTSVVFLIAITLLTAPPTRRHRR